MRAWPSIGDLTIEEPSESREVDRAFRLLSGMAVALGHGVELDLMLTELASGVRRILDADRVSVLLVDQSDRLQPSVAVARRHDEQLWQQFRRMQPVPVDELAGARQALASGGVLVIEDARNSPLVPEGWQRTFQLGSLAIAPLSIDDSVIGVLVVDHVEPGKPFGETQLSLLEGMAALAGVALRGVTDGVEQRDGTDVADAVRLISGARSLRAASEYALDAFVRLSRVSHGLLALRHDADLEVIAVRGSGLPEPGSYPLRDIPDSIVESCTSVWSRAMLPTEVTFENQALTVVPIASRGRLLAAAVLPVTLETLRPDVIADLQVIADVTALSLRALHSAGEWRWWSRTAERMTSSPGGHDDADRLPARVADLCALLSEAGIATTGVVVERHLARVTGLRPATAQVARQIARWQKQASCNEPLSRGAGDAIPLRVGDRVLGALLTSAETPERSRRHLDIGTRALADAVAGAATTSRLAVLERLAVEAASQQAVAGRAYREVGQVIGLLKEHLHTPHRSDPRHQASAEVMVEQIRRLVRDAAGAMSRPTARRPSLKAAMTSVAEQVFAHGGPAVLVRQRGRILALDPVVQVALVRATQRVLNFLRDQRASTASVHIEFTDGRVQVSLVPGQLVDALGPEYLGLHAVISDARGWLAPVGGAVQVENSDGSRHYVLSAPAGVNRPERLAPTRGPRHEDAEVVHLDSTAHNISISTTR